ncbi:MAG: hypothetical protein D6675_09530 [Gemmatimonadetes bacterium]|nr:MAG: hypothetical protein D6675_09530 [Gemmatimonadota bacterium]
MAMMNNICSGILIAMLLMSCGNSQVRLRDIEKDPQAYTGRPVTISGTVVETFSIPLTGKGLYKISDDSGGELWVNPQGRVLERGEHATVTGEIKIGFTVLDKSFGIILVEHNKGE